MLNTIKLYNNLIIDVKLFFSIFSLHNIFLLSIYQVLFRIILIIFFPYLIILYWLLIIYKYIIKYLFMVLDILILDILIYKIDISKPYFVLKYYLELILTDILFIHIPKKFRDYKNSLSIKNIDKNIIKFIIFSSKKIINFFYSVNRFYSSNLYYGKQKYYKILNRVFWYKNIIRRYYLKYRFIKIIFTRKGFYFFKNIIYYFFPLFYKYIKFNSIYYIFFFSIVPKKIYIFLIKKYIFFYRHFLIHLINAYKLRYFTILTVQNTIFFFLYLFWWILIIIILYTLLYNIIIIVY